MDFLLQRSILKSSVQEACDDILGNGMKTVGLLTFSSVYHSTMTFLFNKIKDFNKFLCKDLATSSNSWWRPFSFLSSVIFLLCFDLSLQTFKFSKSHMFSSTISWFQLCEKKRRREKKGKEGRRKEEEKKGRRKEKGSLPK